MDGKTTRLICVGVLVPTLPSLTLRLGSAETLEILAPPKLLGYSLRKRSEEGKPILSRGCLVGSPIRWVGR